MSAPRSSHSRAWQLLQPLPGTFPPSQWLLGAGHKLTWLTYDCLAAAQQLSSESGSTVQRSTNACMLRAEYDRWAGEPGLIAA